MKISNPTSKNLYIEPTWGIFIGQFNDNILHRHYAIQISLASNKHFNITDEKNNVNSYSACFINSNVLHKFHSSEISMIMLINPVSSVGHRLYQKYKNKQITSLHEELNPLSDIFINYLLSNANFEKLIENIRDHLTSYVCTCDQENHFEDDRIYKSIQYLEQNFDKIVSLEEIAALCHLSETRFLHLFKEKTNLNFRRYQLWNKLIRSLPYLRNQSITNTAHQFGFTDSSHYNRTFKETFGLSPKFLLSLK